MDPTDSGNTTLMTTARKERREIVAVLVLAGADSSKVNNAGKSAQDLTEDGFIVELLEKAQSN